MEAPNQLKALNDYHEGQQEQYLSLLKREAYDNLSCFVEYMTPDEPPPVHSEWLCDRLQEVEQRNILRLMVSMPPGHAKTKFCSRYFPAWYLGRHSLDKWLHGGHSQNFVENEFGAAVREIVADDRFEELFPETKLSTHSKSKGAWKLSNNRGGYVTKGVGQGISGYRGNVGFIDDPFASREDAESEAIRKKVYDWFSADFTTRLLPRSPMGIVATRWHTDDLIGRLEKDQKEGRTLIPWYIINLPAVIEDQVDADACPFKRGLGDCLWPNYYTKEHMQNLKVSLPARDWNSLYQGKPTNASGEVMQAEFFHRYADLPKNEKEEDGTITFQNVLRITLSVDAAEKDTERSDFTAISVWLYGADKRHYLADMIRKRMEYPELQTTIENVARKWGATSILVEDAGAGTQYIQIRKHKAPAPIIPIKVPRQSKAFRFDGVVPMFESGDVLIPERAPWLAEFERELLEFPYGGNDDQVDTVSQYLSRYNTISVGGTKKLGGMGIKR